MKNKLLFLIIIPFFLAACNTNTSQNNETQVVVTDSATAPAQVAAAPSETSSCYKYISGKDSVRIQLKTTGNAVTGELIYTFFEKDNNTGTIEGQMKGDTIFADYTFMSEGKQSVREIALLKKGSDLVEGYGEVKEVNSKMVFSNKGTLNFDNKTILKQTDCMTDEHGCVLSMGYAWSLSKDDCIQPSKTGIRLHANGEAGSKAAPAFIVFSDNKQQAELFLPHHTSALLMERKGKEGNQYWENGKMKLYAWKGYVLKRDDKVLYAGQ